MPFTFNTTRAGVFPEMHTLARWVDDVDQHLAACRIALAVVGPRRTGNLLNLSQGCLRLERRLRQIGWARHESNRQTKPQREAVCETTHDRYAALQESRLAIDKRLGLAS